MQRIKIAFCVSVILTIFGCGGEPAIREQAASNTAQSAGETIVDLSHDFSDDTVYWVTAREFEKETVAEGETPAGFYYSANNFSAAEHGGTHIDAPIHFSAGKQTVDEIPLERLIGDAIKIDISAKAANDPDYLVSVDDLTRWEAENGQIADGSIVLLQTGFGKYYPDKTRYMGTDKRGSDAVKDLRFPGLAPEAAEWLVRNRKVNAVGIDTASIDRGQSTDFRSHVILMSENIPAFENVANLDKLPAKGFRVIALPMKIKGGSGGPLRIIAMM